MSLRAPMQSGRSKPVEKRVYYVYILTNQRNTVLYTGITNNLRRRLYEHRTNKGYHFTKRYNITKLVLFEEYASVIDAIRREKQIKAGSRKRKEELINAVNPEWS